MFGRNSRCFCVCRCFFFFLNDTATTEIYTLSLHDALPIWMSIGTGKDRIDLYFFGAGHTSGDTFVVFPALRVLHTGDDFAWKDGPLCDRANGGSCVDLPRTLQKAIAGIKNIDVVIPGHSPMQTPADLATWQKFTAALLSHATDAMKA